MKKPKRIKAGRKQKTGEVKPQAIPDSLSPEQARVLRAAEFAHWINQLGSPKTLQDRHFDMIGINRFRDILNSPHKVLTCSKEEQRAFLDFYVAHSNRKAPLEAIHESLLNLFEITALQAAMAAYVGSYDVFRLSDVPDEIIRGKIIIQWDVGVDAYRFWHTSKQKRAGDWSDTLHDFNHDGTVVVLSNRLYFLGAGIDGEGAYLRPMIMRATDRPKSRPITGLLLTETSDHIPFACKTVMMAEELKKEWLDSFGEDGLRARLLQILKNESSLEGVVYGWSRMTR